MSLLRSSLSLRRVVAVRFSRASSSATPASATGSPAAAAAAAAVPPPAATPAKPAAAPRLRPAVTSAQIRAQRPRATEKVAANPDSSLNAESCGPVLPGPEMVSVVNETTGERLGPRGLEPTRYGDWEAKGRCWDF